MVKKDKYMGFKIGQHICHVSLKKPRNIRQMMFNKDGELLLFLNGVCRHEHVTAIGDFAFSFLNGVCRHEPSLYNLIVCWIFLNGVCRHERWSLAN